MGVGNHTQIEKERKMYEKWGVKIIHKLKKKEKCMKN